MMRPSRCTVARSGSRDDPVGLPWYAVLVARCLDKRESDKLLERRLDKHLVVRLALPPAMFDHPGAHFGVSGREQAQQPPPSVQIWHGFDIEDDQTLWHPVGLFTLA